MHVKFQRYVGIDYSGAETSESRLKALQVFEASTGGDPKKINTPAAGAKNWSRLEVAQYCLKVLELGEPVDHWDRSWIFISNELHEALWAFSLGCFFAGLHAPLADGCSSYLCGFCSQ